MIIFDSSALIAWVKQEIGWEVVPRVAAKADIVMMATINYAEVIQKLVWYGVPAEEAERVHEDLDIVLVPFSPSLARRAAALYVHRSGLSLADRACLALAAEFSAPAYTTDKAWKQWSGQLGVHVVDLRQDV